MMERPNGADGGTHPDEGMIHAWLDDALDAPTAAGIAAHVASCGECAELVAEARGLIAGASWIVRALDEVPLGTRPAWAQTVSSGAPAPAPGHATPAAVRDDGGSLWRLLRVTPARAAIAATLIVALGITLTRERAGMDETTVSPTSARTRQMMSGSATADMGGAASTESQSRPAADSAAAPRDGLLDSAVARSVAAAQPIGRVEAAPSVPQPPAATAPAAELDLSRGRQVAAGRASAQAQMDTGGTRADRIAVRGAVVGNAKAADAVASAPTAAPAAPAPSPVTVSPGAAPGAGGAAGASVAGMAEERRIGGAKECYRIETSVAGARFGARPIPFIAMVDSGPRRGARPATLIPVTGTAPPLLARWERSAQDSIVLSYSAQGTSARLALGPGMSGLSGIARTGPLLNGPAAGDAAQAAARRGSTESTVQREAASNGIPVTARMVTCPNR